MARQCGTTRKEREVTDLLQVRVMIQLVHQLVTQVRTDLLWRALQEDQFMKSSLW